MVGKRKLEAIPPQGSHPIVFNRLRKHHKRNRHVKMIMVVIVGWVRRTKILKNQPVIEIAS